MNKYSRTSLESLKEKAFSNEEVKSEYDALEPKFELIKSKIISHEEAVIEMIQNDKEFAEAYRKAAFEERKEDGGEAAFSIAMHHLEEAEASQKPKKV